MHHADMCITAHNPLIKKKTVQYHLTPSTLLFAQCARGCHRQPADEMHELPEKPPSLFFSIFAFVVTMMIMCWKEEETLVDLSVQFDFVKTFQSELDQTLNFRPKLFSHCLSCSKNTVIHDTHIYVYKISDNNDLNITNNCP